MGFSLRKDYKKVYSKEEQDHITSLTNNIKKNITERGIDLTKTTGVDKAAEIIMAIPIGDPFLIKGVDYDPLIKFFNNNPELFEKIKQEVINEFQESIKKVTESSDDTSDSGDASATNDLDNSTKSVIKEEEEVIKEEEEVIEEEEEEDPIAHINGLTTIQEIDSYLAAMEKDAKDSAEIQDAAANKKEELKNNINRFLTAYKSSIEARANNATTIAGINNLINEIDTLLNNPPINDNIKKMFKKHNVVYNNLFSEKPEIENLKISLEEKKQKILNNSRTKMKKKKNRG